jgi:hypothetical protein
MAILLVALCVALAARVAAAGGGDAELRAKLLEMGVPPEQIEVEFKRVMDIALAE